MSISLGSSLSRNPASVRARISGSSAIGNRTASGALSVSQFTVDTTVLTMSSSGVGRPSWSSLALYWAGSLVGLFDRYRMVAPRSRSRPMTSAAPGSR